MKGTGEREKEKGEERERGEQKKGEAHNTR